MIFQKKLLNKVVPKHYYNNDFSQECYLINTEESLDNKRSYHLYITRKNNEPMASAIQLIAKNGHLRHNIILLVGADFKGTVLDVRVIQHFETLGLGDKIETRISNWITFFSGKTIESENDPKWVVKKYAGEFDQFTGVTITPRAVLNATKCGATFIKKNRKIYQLILSITLNNHV
ncbi:Electron transport complex subunit RsxG [Candidatus Hartigia pinicola]|nr:Electron transport complex subunit RsxG [Candidatus Hartigia pinicola]